MSDKKVLCIDLSDNAFWLFVWSIVAVVVMVIANLTNSYYEKRNEIIKSLIESGVPAIEVQCALEDDFNKEPKCILLASRK